MVFAFRRLKPSFAKNLMLLSSDFSLAPDTWVLTQGQYSDFNPEMMHKYFTLNQSIVNFKTSSQKIPFFFSLSSFLYNLILIFAAILRGTSASYDS
jgi:hypothetical protein